MTDKVIGLYGWKGEMMFKFIRRLLSKRYKTGIEYYVYIRDINVDHEWRKTDIGKLKLEKKASYWRRTGEFQSKVILDRDFNLIDGYSTIRIAEMYDIPKVPAYFVDKEK